MSHGLDLTRFIWITDGFVPVMFDENLLCLNVERDRSVAPRAVLIILGRKVFQEIAELPKVKVRRQSRFVNGIPRCIFQLRSFGSPFIALTVIVNRYSCDAGSSQQTCKLEYFHFPFLIFPHDILSFFFRTFRATYAPSRVNSLPPPPQFPKWQQTDLLSACFF